MYMWDFSLNANKIGVYLDFEGNQGDVWEENIEDLEFCQRKEIKSKQKNDK